MPNMHLNLVKYCKSNHAEDAIKTGKIFVGTFSRYKKIENEALRDIEEGASIPAVLDNEQELLISEDDNDSLLAHSSIKLANGWKLQLPKGMPLWLEQPEFNTFIYCVSNDPCPSIEKANRLGYDSFFRITDPVGFGRALMFSLAQHYSSKFGVKADIGLVNYVTRKIEIVNHQTPSRPDKSFSMSDLFTKNERYREDQEFRYVIRECSNQEQTEFNSFNIDGVIIENIEITKWVKPA